MDFYSSVARRTRSQKALYFRADYEKRKNTSGGGKAGLEECSRRKSVDSINGDNVRVRESRKLECTKEKEAKHAQEKRNCVPVLVDSEEDEVAEVNDGSEGGKGGSQKFGSASLDKEDHYKTDKDFITVEGSTSSSEDGDANGKDNGSMYDVKRGTMDDAAEEEEEEESGAGRGVKGKGSSGVTASVPVKVRKDKDNEDNITDEDSFSLEESTSSSEDGEDDVGTYDVKGGMLDGEEEEESGAGRGVKGKGSTGVTASVPAKGRKDKDNEDNITDEDCFSVEESTSSSDDGEDDVGTYDVKGGMLDGEEEEEEEEEEEGEEFGVGTRLKRKRSSGLNVTVPTKKDKKNKDNEDYDIMDKDFINVEDSTSVGYADEEINDSTCDLKRGRFDDDEEEDGEEESSAGMRQKRQKYCGMNVSLPVKKNNKDKENPKNSIHNSCVAHRTRSHFNWSSSLKKRKKQQRGTVTHPICFDLEGNDSSSESRTDDDEDHGRERSGGNGIEDADEKQLRRKAGGEVKKRTKGKSVSATKSVMNLLVDTMLDKGQVLEKELNNSEDETAEEEISPPIAEISLPLKFSFGIIKSKPKEKSDHEKEMDHLWAELDFVLRSSEIGCFTPSTVDDEDAKGQQVETYPSASCELGKHDLILDEQIGIICRLCACVQLEIKYVLPPMTTWERWSKNNAFTEGDFSMLDGFEFPAMRDDFHGSSVNTRGTVWDRFPRIREKMYPHQQEGFELMWKNLAGGIDLEVNKLNCCVGGSVISHAPGTGKTFLTIAFLYTYMEIFKECRPLVIAPCSMLLTWEEEFKKWNVDIPFYNLNAPELSGKENRIARRLMQNGPRSQKLIRVVKLYSWSQGKSILGISYPLFEKLAGDGSVKEKDRKKQGNTLSDKIRKILLEMPSLLVLDEGHTARNTNTGIWKALKNIKTERRIILSGTPFQNNLRELFNMLWLVRPTFADRISCKTQKIGRRPSKLLEKIQMEEARVKFDSLTNYIGEDSDDKLLERFRTLLEPFVHVHGGSILQKNLPGLKDCVVVLKPPALQKQILEDIQKKMNPLKLEHVMSLVSVHPSLLTKCCWLRNDKTVMEKITAKSFKLNPNEGVKTWFLMELIRLSEALNEKVLVFSQYIDPFSLIKDQLRSRYNWTEGKEVLQMDGKLDLKVRQTLIKHFNDPCGEVRVLLASTRACCEGINLVGASRIVLLDVVWNPSVERQAISRAYRLGQKKVVYTYHLITSGTKEADKYCIQAKKDHLSKLVFSVNGDTDKQNISSAVSHDKILEEMVGHKKLADMFDDIIYQPKESDLVKTFGSVTSKQTGNGS